MFNDNLPNTNHVANHIFVIAFVKNKNFIKSHQKRTYRQKEIHESALSAVSLSVKISLIRLFHLRLYREKMISETGVLPVPGRFERQFNLLIRPVRIGNLD